MKEGHENDDNEIAMINARKMKELQKRAAAHRTQTEKEQKQNQLRDTSNTFQDMVLHYLYDRGDEVLRLAESQYPAQTRAIIKRLAELIDQGEIQQRISGGELLSLFRSLGLNIRINTSIKIQDHGKMVSISDKLKQSNETAGQG